MRKPSRIVIAAVAAVLAMTMLASAQSNEGSITADRRDEKLVREVYDRFIAAWNAHDVAAIGKMWSIDGDHMEPDGETAKGREAVTMLMKRRHDTVFKTTRLNLSIADVWFMPGDVALVDGGYEIYGIRGPDGKELPARRGHLTSVLIKEQGQWWIAASRLMVPATLPYKR
jgi:uncharacterized protein (TIGR02246 family)